MYSADCDENITIQATAISLSLQRLKILVCSDTKISNFYNFSHISYTL